MEKREQRIDLFKSEDFLETLKEFDALKAEFPKRKGFAKNSNYHHLVQELTTKILNIAIYYKENAYEVALDDDPFENDIFIKSYDRMLSLIRRDGISKITHLIADSRGIKNNKQLDPEIKKVRINENKTLIEDAKFHRAFYKPILKTLVDCAVDYSELVGRFYFELNKTDANERIRAAKAYYFNEKERVNKEHMERLASLEPLKQDADRKERLAHFSEKKAINLQFKVRKAEVTNDYKEKVKSAKSDRFNAFVELYGFQNRSRNNRSTIKEGIEYRYRSYIFNFELKDYLLRNALYFIVLFYFLIVIILSRGSLLTFSNLIAIAGQTSTKLFFSLGVAGLILIAGTDLSIGRMTGMTAIIASIAMSGQVFTTNQGWVLDFTSLPTFGRVAVALLLAIVLAVIFSTIAGFFTAKFKMHPFITTLSTQLLIFGSMMILFSNVPSFRIEGELKSTLAGYRNINIIIVSIIAVLISWFIWNKTKFGKHMYAVGGNAEAASVSGINVFWVTMGIFMMAGIYYGVGGFFEAIRVGTAQPNTGAGTELDAIAACVVGGISFSGGIGKIRGAVIGTIIFTGITYTLTYLGYDPNIQFIFKGIIIMAAVCLDSLKYLKKT